ncbi:MAG: hypothetical protein JWO77_2822 [Ilumatobacteraceae bacterium]|nr:hypothetical protein [Ilumatobacteraceae bacterium]
MPKPQQPELRRNGYGATDDDSAKVRADHIGASPSEDIGPVPPESRAGHHPETDHDKPTGPPPRPSDEPDAA